MELGIIGNCQFNALVDKYGNIPWLCWPRFDSSFVFGSLLDEEKGGVFRVCPKDGQEGTQSYITNTNVLRTKFETSSGAFEIIDFAPRFFQHDRYFKPTMLVRIVRPISGAPLVQVKCRPTYNYGRETLKSEFGSNHIQFDTGDQGLRLTTNASLTMVSESLPFVLDSPIYLCLTWGRPLESTIGSTCEDFLERTILYWQRWVKHCYLPLEYQSEVIRSALVLKLHQFEDTGAIIASTTTSLPEAKGTTRNWDYRYCWLRDALFSLLALQRLTQFEEMEKFVGYLRNIVYLQEDKLQPVYSVSGEAKLTEYIAEHLVGYKGHRPVRVGNQAYEHDQHDVYGEMIMAISQLFLDKRFVDGRRLAPNILLERLIDKIEVFLDKPDAGIWEFRGTEQLHTFTMLMHWAGARKAAEIAKTISSPELETRVKKILESSEEIMRDKCFDKELGCFVQASGRKEMDASLLMLINLGFLKAGDVIAERQIDCIARELCANENGLLHRYKHQDDFGSTENAFTVCSFWMAEAYARLGRMDEARKLFEVLLEGSNDLGLYSEDLDPCTMEQWGNFPQTYSHVGLINAAFAISPPLEI